MLPEILKRDKGRYEHRPPKWKESEEASLGFERKADNQTNLRRGPEVNSKKFVMDDIRNRGHQKRKDFVNQFGLLKEKCDCSPRDEDLAEPWLKAETRREELMKSTPEAGVLMQAEMELIRQHVVNMFNEHKDAINDPGKHMETGRKGKKDVKKEKRTVVLFSKLPIEVRQNIMRNLSARFNASLPGIFLILSPEEIPILRASFAYIHDIDIKGRRGSHFPWDVATGTLCEIKAKKFGNAKVMTPEFYEALTVHPHYMKS